MLQPFVHIAEKQTEPVLRCLEPILRDISREQQHENRFWHTIEPVLLNSRRTRDSLSVLRTGSIYLRTGSYTKNFQQSSPIFSVSF